MLIKKKVKAEPEISTFSGDAADRQVSGEAHPVRHSSGSPRKSSEDENTLVRCAFGFGVCGSRLICSVALLSGRTEEFGQTIYLKFTYFCSCEIVT